MNIEDKFRIAQQLQEFWKGDGVMGHMYSVLANGIIRKGIDGMVEEYQEKIANSEGHVKEYYLEILDGLIAWKEKSAET